MVVDPAYDLMAPALPAISRQRTPNRWRAWVREVAAGPEPHRRRCESEQSGHSGCRGEDADDAGRVQSGLAARDAETSMQGNADLVAHDVGVHDVVPACIDEFSGGEDRGDEGRRRVSK